MFCDNLVSCVLSVVTDGSMDLQVKQYRKNLSKTNKENRFLSPWGGVVCRNFDDLGDLLSFKNIALQGE